MTPMRAKELITNIAATEPRIHKDPAPWVRVSPIWATAVSI